MTTLTDCSLTAVPSQIDCDICIVGSGFGGAFRCGQSSLQVNGGVRRTSGLE